MKAGSCPLNLLRVGICSQSGIPTGFGDKLTILIGYNLHISASVAWIGGLVFPIHQLRYLEFLPKISYTRPSIGCAQRVGTVYNR